MNAQDARKFAAEFAHAALKPVAFVFGNKLRNRFDQTRAVLADDSHHEGHLHMPVLHLLRLSDKRFPAQSDYENEEEDEDEGLDWYGGC
jgi:hypothetical protein